MLEITLTAETEARLCEQARIQGEEVNTLAESYVVAMLAWEKRELEESLKIIARSMADIEAGRTKPASRVIAKMRETLRKGVTA